LNVESVWNLNKYKCKQTEYDYKFMGWGNKHENFLYRFFHFPSNKKRTTQPPTKKMNILSIFYNLNASLTIFINRTHKFFFCISSLRWLLHILSLFFIIQLSLFFSCEDKISRKTASRCDYDIFASCASHQLFLDFFYTHFLYFIWASDKLAKASIVVSLIIIAKKY
jgi:hypothetical protein